MRSTPLPASPVDPNCHLHAKRVSTHSCTTPILCCSYGLLKRVLWIQGKVDGEASKGKFVADIDRGAGNSMSSMLSKKKKTFATLFSGIPSRLTSLFSPSHPALCPSRNLADLSSFVSSILSDHLQKSFRTSTSLSSLFFLTSSPAPCQYQSAALSTRSSCSGAANLFTLMLKEDLGILFLLLLISVFPKTRSLAVLNFTTLRALRRSAGGVEGS